MNKTNMTHPEIERGLAEFEKSPVMERVQALESFCYAHGFKDFLGKTLQEEFLTSLERMYEVGREEERGAIITLVKTNKDPFMLPETEKRFIRALSRDNTKEQ